VSPKVRGYAVALLALTAASAVVAPACSPESKSISRPDAGPRSVVVGMSVSLTGDNSGVGTALRDGTVAAVNLINGYGGVLGKRFEVVFKDDASNNSTAGDQGVILRGVIQGFIDEGVSAILGPGASVQLDDAQRLAYPRDSAGNPLPGSKPTLLISAWSTSPRISDVQRPWPDRYLYRTAPSDSGQTRAMVKLMTEGPSSDGGGDAGAPDAGGGPGVVHKCRSPFLVYSDDIIGKGYFDYLPGAFQARGITLPSVSIPTDAVPDYSQQINAVLAAKPDCIAMAAYLGGAVAMLPKLREAINRTPDFPRDYYFIGNDALYDQKFISDISLTDPTIVENMVGVVPDTAPPTAQYAEFKQLFQVQTGTTGEPPPYSANAFDGAILLALAIQHAGTTETVAVKDALMEVSRGYPGSASGPGAINPTLITPGKLNQAFSVLNAGGKIDYHGASGPVNFDAKGDVLGNYIKWVITGGAYQTVARYIADDLPK